MRKAQRKQVAQYVRNSRLRSGWRKVVQFMACIVVFCTTYALILPAITAEKTYFCGLEAHEHTEQCFTQETVSQLVCEIPEQTAHTHGKDCYEEETLVCTQPEVVPHTHEEACFAESGELSCTLPELIEHTHADACYAMETLSELVCGMEVHVHTDACRADPEADLETPATWEATMERVTLTGNWTEDLTAIAASQVGYRESEKNYLESHKGYTRYGAWYGVPYGEWDSMFVSFCLNYADIPYEAIPWGSNSGNWLELLRSKELTANAVTTVPGAGDLLFYREEETAPVRSAIVLGLEVQEDAGIALRIIEGAREDQVVQQLIRLDEIELLECFDTELVQQGWDALTEPAETTAPIETTTPADTTAPIETTTPAETTEPVETTVPADTTVPEETTVPAETTAPVETTTPAETTAHTETTVPEETTAPTEPIEEPVKPQLMAQTAQTENYVVSVTYSSDLLLPEGAELRVEEYPKDSDIFLQRCEEAGYELEWLLNIGFFVDDVEVILNGDFHVLVTSKEGKDLGQDITHFADSGAERIDGADASEVVAEGQTAVSFNADGFSDFGGGVAPTAETGGVSTFAVGDLREADTFSFVTANPASLQEGVDYAIYVASGQNYYFLGSTLSSVDAYNTGYYSSPTTIGSNWSLSSSQMGTTFASDFTWRVIKSGSQYYLESQKNGNRLQLGNGLSLTANGSALTNTVSGATTTITSGNYRLRNSNGWSSSNRQAATSVYFAAVTPAYRNYPSAVYTGDVHVDRLRFYNICEGKDDGISALAGCVFQITGTTEDGQPYSTTITSGNSPQIALPSNIPDGKYTITEVSAPDGYMRDLDNVREFWIDDGALVSEHNIGTFLNHTLEKLTVGKSGEVEDYNNRIYQILLDAKTNLGMYHMDPIEVLFVVDKSNSMLFPSGMEPTGKSITLRYDGTNNVSRNQSVLNSLDKSKMHYIIADPNGTSTVYAIWHDGTAWLYQDASYYAKAKFNNGTGYESDGETVIFPGDRAYSTQSSWEDSTYGTEYRSNGGGLNHSFQGSTLGTYIDTAADGTVDQAASDSVTFQLYTAKDQYNRLHYLEEALANMIYELADANHENRVTLIPFTKEVQTQIYYPLKSTTVVPQPVTLTTSNAEMLFDIVTHIDTAGGTRQDLALEYAYETYLDEDDGFDKAHTYTILITDGAPVRSGSSAPPLGSPSSAATTADNGEIYGRIKGWGAQVRKESTLMTVALGMEFVEGGRQVLSDIATSDQFYCALDDASSLTENMQRILFDGMKNQGELRVDNSLIVDEITDSFYPIAWTEPANGASTGRTVLTQSNDKSWLLLRSGDWITLDGKFTTADSDDAAGQLLQKADGTYYIQWQNQLVSGSGWNGTFYVKAKEDFIGGNAIDTNKNAYVTVHDATKTVDTPTVNVHLLDLNENSSRVTVYLGDTINSEDSSPRGSLRSFYNQIVFSKLQDETGITNVEMLNRLNPDTDTADGLERNYFYLKYALGYEAEDGTWVPRELTTDEWTTLESGGSLTIPYVYDNASSHGNVGYFTITLNKTSDTYRQHEATEACQPGGQPLTEDCDDPAEVYTLTVTYTAYELGEAGRPSANVNNGSGTPGTEVTKEAVGLKNGQGIVTSENVHEVHVISGKIEVVKDFTENTEWAEGDTFTFLLKGPDGKETSQTVTIGSSGTATAVFDSLKRGTYTLSEAAHEDYMVKTVTVGTDTNAWYTGPEDFKVSFTMGNNLSNENVIGKAAETDTYTSYIDPVNGVYGEAVFTNAPRVYTGEIPVEKIWDDGNENHAGDAVYIVLCLDDQPVLDTDGNARLLRVNAASNWEGVFTVALANKDDSVANYNYSVREVANISTTELNGWHSAVLENDGETLLYYDEALPDGGLLGVGGIGYIVEYSAAEDGTHVVTNLKGYIIPETGGMGTHLYTFSGLACVLAALMYGYSLRRKRERGASS